MGYTEAVVDYEVDVPVRVTDFDQFGRLKPSAALSLFQEAATRQADLMHIGHADMAERGVFWAVIRTYYEVVRQPELYTIVKVRTWPHSPSRFSFLRDYLISSQDGEVLVRGTSEWVIMNNKTREFVNMKEVYEPPENLLTEHNFEKKPRKIRDFEHDDLEPYHVIPPYTSIDVNGHVNNSIYGDYPFDAANPEKSYQLESFQIDFRHEVHQGEELEIYTATEDGEFLGKGIRPDGEVAFITRTTFTS